MNRSVCASPLFGMSCFVERSKFIQKHSKLLKKLAYQFELTVIILNNVVAEMSQD